MLIDGVNKIWTVQQRGRSMHFDGFKSERELVESLMRYTRIEHTPEDCIAWLESLKSKIDAAVLQVKQDYEIDGHKRPAEEITDG